MLPVITLKVVTRNGMMKTEECVGILHREISSQNVDELSLCMLPCKTRDRQHLVAQLKFYKHAKFGGPEICASHNVVIIFAAKKAQSQIRIQSFGHKNFV